MLSEQEYTAAVAALTEGQTEIDALEQQVRDHISKAREHNHARAVASNKKTELQHKLEPLRQAVNQHNQEVAAAQNAKRKAEAEENARKAAEKQAAEKSEIEKLREENAKLQEQLAAKG
jgi:hypothetical protein